MKLLQRGTVALFILVLAGCVGLGLYVSRCVDRTPPVITCDTDVVEVRVGASDAALLKGVTASDDVDGDLTDTVMIKGVSQLITADTAKITYIVFDSANNMATASRTVRYTNYEKPRFSLERPLIYLAGSKIQLLDRLYASDVIDGDLTDSIRVTTQNVNAAETGVYAVTVQVTNSLGDVESLPLKLEVVGSGSVDPAVSLSQYIVNLQAGAQFSPADYIIAPAEPGAVEIDSDVSASTPGVYEVSYTCRGDTVYQTVVVR